MLDRLNFEVYQDSWSAREELQLFQGIMRCGMDNWVDISELVKTKTKEECEAHYYAFYYKSREDFMPYDEDCILRKRLNGDAPP